MTADGKAVDRRDPELFRTSAVHIVGQGIRPGHAAIKFIHKAQVTLQEPDERYLSTIKMCQVDAGAEQALAGIFRMRHRTAA